METKQSTETFMKIVFTTHLQKGQLFISQTESWRKWIVENTLYYNMNAVLVTHEI